MHPHNQLSFRGFAVWSVCVVFFLYEFLLRTVIGTFQTSLMVEVGLNRLEFSILSSSVFMLIYSIMQIPAGIIVGNMGLRNSLLLGVISCVIATFGFSYTTDFSSAIFYRVLMAFGSSFGFVCMLVSISHWLPLKARGIFIGISQFIGTIGPMISGGPLEMMTEGMSLNWRDIFLILAMFGMLLALIIFVVVHASHKKLKEYMLTTSIPKLRRAIFRIIKRSQPWFIAIYSAVIYCALEYLSENEGRNFLVLKGIRPADAAYMISYSWFGYAVGCPVLGLLSDYIRRRKTVMLSAAIVALLSIIDLIYADNYLLVLLGFIGIGFGASGQSIAFAAVAEQCDHRFIPVGVGVNNTLIGIIASTNVFLISSALDTSAPQPAIIDYQRAFAILIVLAAAAVVIASMFVRETYCKVSENFTRV